jgi:colanic acid/amylovoran biosynthesis protein
LPESQLKAIEHLKTADLIVSSAGGFLLDANATIYSHLLQFHFMRRFKRPYILAPQTIGPIRATRLKKMTAAALSDARMIAVREQYSYDFVTQDLGLPGDRVVRTTDIAFEHEASDPDIANAALADLGIGETEQFIGATTVNWKFRGEDDPAAAYATYTDKMVALFTELHERTGLRVLIYNQVSQDLPLAKAVAERCAPFVVLDEADRSTEVMRGMIERASVMLGSRFHSCVFALLGRVPLYCLAYTYKSTGIMDDLGLSDLVCPINAFDVSETADRVQGLLEDRDAAKKRIDTAVNSMKFPRFSTVLQDAYAKIAEAK